MKRGVRPDMVTDQTSAHDPLHGYLPKGWSWEEYQQKAESDPQGTILAAKRSMADHVQAMLAFHEMGVPTFDYGNNIRQMAQEVGVSNAFDFPGFVPAYIRPLFCRGIGPFRWVALSGNPQDIYKTDAKVKEIIKDDQHLHHWLDMARERISFQGLPARICWVGLEWRQKLGLAFNEMVRSGESPRRSSLAGITLTPAPSPARTAKPKRCAMVLMRSPTGRCSTPCLTPPAARPGCRCTTAAG